MDTYTAKYISVLQGCPQFEALREAFFKMFIVLEAPSMRKFYTKCIKFLTRSGIFEEETIISTAA